MSAQATTKPRPLHWDSLILVVYSVLVGLSLDKNFDFFSSSPDHLYAAILMVGLLIVVLENWVYLPLYLRAVDIESTGESSLYLISAIVYSCIPALYMNQTGLWGFGATEWIALNFALICIVDSLTKAFTVRKMHRRTRRVLSEDERAVVGAYLFYSITGFFYAVLLFIQVAYLFASALTPIQKALILYHFC